MKAWYLRLSNGAKLALVVSLITTVAAAAAFLLSWTHTVNIQALGEPAGAWAGPWECTLTGRGVIESVTPGDNPVVSLSGVDNEGSLYCLNSWHNGEATASEIFIPGTPSDATLQVVITDNGEIGAGADVNVSLLYTWPTLAPGGSINATVGLELGYY